MATPTPMFQRVALLGIGLIGSSLSHAMRRGGLAGEITAAARTGRTRETALRLGLADRVYVTPAEAVTGADLVILCTPVGAYAGLAEAIGPHLHPGAIITDVGPVKADVVRERQPLNAIWSGETVPSWLKK